MTETILVSNLASYVTGRAIFVDGGMTDYPGDAPGGSLTISGHFDSIPRFFRQLSSCLVGDEAKYQA